MPDHVIPGMYGAILRTMIEARPQGCADDLEQSPREWTFEDFRDAVDRADIDWRPGA